VNEEQESDKSGRLYLYQEKGRKHHPLFSFIWVQRGLKPNQHLVQILLAQWQPPCLLSHPPPQGGGKDQPANIIYVGHLWRLLVFLLIQVPNLHKTNLDLW